MKARITIADVAREAGVSAQTVSRVVNDKGEISPATRQIVTDVIERLGYRPSAIARSLATNRTWTLGLVVPDIANPFFPEIVRGAEDAARQRGYTIFVCNTDENPEQEAAVLRLLEERRTDGVVVCSSRLPDERLHALLAHHPSAVLVNRPAPAAVAGAVRIDDAAGTRRAVQHVLDSGRRTIGMLAGPPGSYSAQERRHSFEAALAAAGLPGAPVLPCAPNLAGGMEATGALLAAHPAIDGLICYNDLVAIGAIQACAARGRRVPEDVAVIGCDDIMLAGLVTPPLTTLRIDKYQLGVVAISMLFDRMEGRAPSEPRVLPLELVARASAP
jgi:LacI family transcriptional regulator